MEQHPEDANAELTVLLRQFCNRGSVSPINRRVAALEEVITPKRGTLVACTEVEADRMLAEYDARGEARPDRVVVLGVPISPEFGKWATDNDERRSR